jgi:hypothetical protein
VFKHLHESRRAPRVVTQLLVVPALINLGHASVTPLNHPRDALIDPINTVERRSLHVLNIGKLPEPLGKWWRPVLLR